MNPATNTSNTYDPRNYDPRNPWTGEPLPPLPEVSNPENWIFDFADDGELYRVYEDDNGPAALTFDALANQDGTIECGVMSWTSELLDLDQLAEDAARIPAWIEEIRAVTQWTQDAFAKQRGGGAINAKQPIEHYALAA